MRERGQLGLPVVEAAVGVLLVLAVIAGFAFGTPHPDGAQRQLDAYARDTAAVLAADAPRHAGSTRLEEVAASRANFERERDALDRRVARVLPANCLYRVETPHGAVGYPRPPGVPVGSARVATANGAVVVEVWYA